MTNQYQVLKRFNELRSLEQQQQREHQAEAGAVFKRLCENPLSAPSNTPSWLMSMVLLCNKHEVYDWCDRPVNPNSTKVKNFLADLRNNPNIARSLVTDVNAPAEQQLSEIMLKMGYVRQPQQRLSLAELHL